MKNLAYAIAFFTLTVTLNACGEDEAALPSDYVEVGVDDDKIDKMIAGQWTKYTVAQTTYSSGKEQIFNHPTQTYSYIFTQAQGGYGPAFTVQNFPTYGQFEVRRYGKRFTFYNRSSDLRMEFMLDEVTATKLVFKKFDVYGPDYFFVESHILTK